MSEYDEVIELGARALDDSENSKRKIFGGAGKRPATSVSRRRVDTMLSSLNAAGYALVKREATEAMIEAMWEEIPFGHYHTTKDLIETIPERAFNAAIAAGDVLRKGGE